MQIHHLGLGQMRPYGGGLMDGSTEGIGPAHMVCHCLLLETEQGLVLVDTGVVGADPARTARLIHPFFRFTDRIDFDPAAAARNQIQRLGLAAADVRHIVMTHLDFDHAAGLVDFPQARVHLSATEAAAPFRAVSPKERARYRTAAADDRSRWITYDSFTADFHGLPAAELQGLPQIRLVRLPGHTRGHCGVAIEQPGGRILLHAGDAIFNIRELDPDHPRMPTGARFYQWFMESSQPQRRRSLAALRRLRREHGTMEIVCTHDPALLRHYLRR